VEVIPCVRNFHLVGERILGDSFPKNPSWIRSGEKNEAFLQENSDLTVVNARKLAITVLLSLAAGFAEYVNLERWGLDINS
jgi:hypothetical protein